MVQPTITQPFLQRSRAFPQDPTELEPILTKSWIEIAIATNARVIGTFETFQAVTGELWYANPNTVAQTLDASAKRQSYRTVYPWTQVVGPGATITIVHGLTQVVDYTRIEGTVHTDVPDSRSVNYSDAMGDENIQTRVGTTDITITNGNGAGTASLTSGIVILEYLLN